MTSEQCLCLNPKLTSSTTSQRPPVLTTSNCSSGNYLYTHITISITTSLGLVNQSCPTHCDPMLLCPWDSPGKNTGVGCHALLQGIFQPRDQTQSPTLQADSLLSQPPGKPKNMGVGSLPLLQGIFPTQEFNWGLLHGRRILYQLSYQGSAPSCTITPFPIMTL